MQPIHGRYWLHGKGPAPVGNMPVAVHWSPTRVTLRETALEGFDPPAATAGDAGALRLSVAAGPGGGAGEVALIVPEGLVADVDGAPAGPALPYRLGGGEYATWDVAVRALPQTPGGRYFVAARISDELGQSVEDTALVTIGEPGAPTPDRDPMEAFFLLPADVAAQAGEAGLEVAPPSLSLAPGAAGSLQVRVSNHLACELRGEVQVLAPYGAWDAVPDWAAPVRADAGLDGDPQLSRLGPRRRPARMGIVAAGEADVLRPRPLFRRRPGRRHTVSIIFRHDVFICLKLASNMEESRI